MDCKGTASVLGIRNRRLSAKQKLPKRVSFKDEIWVIQIPAREESAVNLRDSIVFTRNSIAGNSWTNNKPDITNRQASLETVSTTSLRANEGQRSPQTTQTCRRISSGQEASRPPYKSILKTPTSIQQKKSNLNHTYLPARNTRQVSARHDFSDSCNAFKHDLSHLLPSRDTIHRFEKSAFTRSQPSRHTASLSRAVGARDGALYNKSTRFLGQDFSFNRTSSDYDFLNQNEKARTINAAKQPQVNFDIVGVTYGRVDKMPHFYDISGIMKGVKEYPPVSNLPNNDRSRLEHSAVSTTNPSDSKRATRHSSAIPAIAAFNRKNRDTRKHFSSTWIHEYDSSPKRRELPMAWQPAKQYNFSTR